MALYNAIRGPVRQSLNMLFNDQNLAKTVTFKRYSGQQWDNDEGAMVDQYEDTSCKAVRLRHTHKSIQALGMVGKIEVGEFVFMFQVGAKGLSVKPTDRDIIVDEDGITHNITESTDVFQFAYVVNVEGS